MDNIKNDALIEFDFDDDDSDEVECISLHDEETGEDMDCLILSRAELDNKKYLLVIEVEELDNSDDDDMPPAVVLRESIDGNETVYTIIEDDDEFNKVVDFFQQADFGDDFV